MNALVAAPLFCWSELAAIDALRQQREDLQASIERLPKMAHRRLVLEARLSDLTVQQLALEMDVQQ